MKKVLSIAVVSILAAVSLAGCTKPEQPAPPASTEQTTAADQPESDTAAPTEGTQALTPFTIGASPAPHTEILKAAKEEMAAKGYELVIKEYTDYVQPNLALDAGDLDANYFQHMPYLEQFNEQNGTSLMPAASIHYEPFGIYAGKTGALEELTDGAKIAVPNDVSNEARALLLLEAEGLITLKEGAGLNATKLDIVENEKNLEILEIEAAQLPRSLQDVDIAVINGNYAIEAGLSAADALASEDASSIAAVTYGNIIAVQEGQENSDAVLALIDCLTSQTVKDYIDENYNGAVVPLF